MRKKTKKKIALGAIAAAAVACAAVAVSIFLLPAGGGDDAGGGPPQEGQPEEPAAPDGESASSSSGSLSDLDWYASLSGSEQRFAEIIMNNTWATDSGSVKVSFTPKGRIVIQEDGEDEETHKVSISDVQISDDGLDTGTAALTVDGDAYVLKLVPATGTAGKVALVTNYLEDGEKLYRQTGADTFKVAGPDMPGWSGLAGKDGGRLARQLADWCQDRYPTAKSATWTGSYQVFPAADKGKTVEGVFALDNSEQTTVYADRTDGKWTFTAEEDHEDPDSSSGSE